MAARQVRIAGLVAMAVGFSLVLYLFCCMALGVGLAELVMHLPRRPVREEATFRQRIADQFGAAVQDVSIRAADGVDLSAWFIPAPHPNGRAVVLLHGIAGNRVDVSGYSDIFLAKGYAVLLPDSREHGNSGGPIATFGVLEREDVSRWVMWLRTREPGCTYLLGESMGAAIAVEATPVVPDLCAVAVEDPFASFRQVAYDRLGRMTGLGSWFWRTAGYPAVEAAFWWAHLRYGIWLPDARPRRALEESEVPVLLMTGTADRMIPMRHAEELQSVCGPRCALWVVPGAVHGGISTTVGTQFGHRILMWFAEHDRLGGAAGPADTGSLPQGPPMHESLVNPT